MTKLRVYEYAKELNMSSKEIISILKRLDVPVNNHMSVIDANAQGKITQFFDDVKRKANEDKMKKAAEKEKRPEQMKVETKRENMVENSKVETTEQRPAITEQTNTDRTAAQTSEGNRYSGNRQTGSDTDRRYQSEGRSGDQRGYRSDGGNRPPRQDGDQRGYGNRPPRQDGDQRGYGNRPPRQDGDQRGFRPDGGNRPPRQDGDQRGYRPDGNRPPRQDGDQRGYGNRPPRQDGDQRGYGNRPPRQDGDQRGYRPDGGNRPPRQDGDQRGYGNRPPRQDGDQRGYGNRPPRQDGDQRGFRPDGGNRPPRPAGDFRGGRPEGGFKGPRPGGQFQDNRGPRPDRDARGGDRRSGGLVVPPPAVTEEKQEIPRRRNQPKKPKEKTAFDDKKVKRNVKGVNLKPIDFENDRSEVVAGKKRNKMKKNKDVVYGENKETPTKISIEDTITVGDFAKMIGKDTGEVIKKLLLLGIMTTINQEIDFDVVTLVASDYGIEVEKKEVINEDEFETIIEHDEPEQLLERPPVVTIMGHVDHGKTTLLDSIRNTRVTLQEAGGITQHIGAYQVEVNDKKITFLDTPGHEAFTAMRARGAKVTDITILVVAADDGVMPQTIEAVNHAKAAEVPIIVAVNKMDKPTANPERVMQELSNLGLLPEDWGGDTIFVPVSALKGEGIDQLLEMVLLVSEVQELKANPNKRARGTVVEAELDKGKGPIATVLVQHGTLKIGDAIVVGTAYGRIRSMINDIGQRITEAKPSTPIEITGLDSVPQAGDQFMVFENDSKAKAIADRRSMKKHELGLKKNSITLDDLFNQIKEGEVKDLNLIIKADVQGTVEALRSSLEKIQVEGVRVRIIHTGVGTISESDVILAATSNAIVIGFNVRPDVNARQTAELEKVDIRTHSIIYKVIEEIEGALKGMLDPEYREKVIGQAEVRQTFKVSKVGTIAGSYVTDGKITRDSEVRVIREGIVIHTGKLDALKRFKDDVKEVSHGYECGITVKNFNDIEEGDILEAFIMEEIAR